jgi:DNA mismatch endonuclease (patch repair protein)
MVDFMSAKQRSYCMSRVKGKDTELERVIRSELFKLGFRYRKNVKELPGRPDIVFSRAKAAIFIDGDFWHGYDFDKWKYKLSPFWVKKIQDNIDRDQRNIAKLESNGWNVLRIWGHEIQEDLPSCILRIETLLKQST